MPHSAIFKELSYVFIAAILGGALAWRLRQPLILGYVLAGIAISPFTPGPQVRDPHTFQVIAEVGVVFLMFSIGLEFSLKELLEVKWVALVGGPLGIALSGMVGAVVGHVLGWGVVPGLVVGLTISVASTMVLSRLLMDGNQLQSPQGKVMIGITLVEDLAVVVLTILMPVLVSLNLHHLLGVGKALGKAALILIPLGILAAYLVPRLLRWVARANNNELFLLVLLAICLGTAALTEAVGLSLALGAFAAGLIVSASDYAHRALDQLLPLRDAFVALFFVTVGILINPRAVLVVPRDHDRDSPAGNCGQVRDLGRHRETVSLSMENCGAGWDGTHADRRVLVHPRPGCTFERLARRPFLLLHAGGVAGFHPDQRGAGALGAAMGRRS